MMNALKSMRAGEEAAMWLDADAVFSNFDFAAHSLLSTSIQEQQKQGTPEQPDLMICRDLSVPRDKPTCTPICLNTGTFLLRKTPWSVSFLDVWWNMVGPTKQPYLAWGLNHEESALATLYGEGWGGMRNRTQVFRATAFNSVPPFHLGHEALQPVMHAAGEPAQVRELAFMSLAAALSDSTGVWTLDIEGVLPKLGDSVAAGYEAAHEADPTNADVATALGSMVRERNSRGEGRASEGEANRARQLLREAMRLAPEDVEKAVAYGSLAAQV